MQVVRTPLGMLQQQSACPQCQGTGEVVDEYCGSCSGRGRVQKNKQLKITVPAGVDNGSRLRIRKEGDAGPKGGAPGDLYVFLSVKADKNFKRDGADIYSQVRVSYVDAILGTEMKVATVDGDVDLKISAGTQPETVMRLDGKGAPKLGAKGRGTPAPSSLASRFLPSRIPHVCVYVCAIHCFCALGCFVGFRMCVSVCCNTVGASKLWKVSSSSE